jgi:hypothetical protein
MRLPIDTQHLNFIAVGIPEAVVDFDTKQPRHDPDGRALYSLSIVAIGGEGADILRWPACPRASRPDHRSRSQIWWPPLGR